jgi:uncharacterized protein
MTSGAIDVHVEEVDVEMSDGVKLVADVIRAGTTPQPALLIRSPYGRAPTRAAYDVVGLARSGWVIVVQDTRGRGSSAGDGTPFVHERSDGSDTVAWCAQQPWCDGRVAMIGASYVGFTQWQAAASYPPALKAIGPTQACANIREDCFYEGGVFKSGFAASYATFMASTDGSTTPAALQRLTELARNPQHTMASSQVRDELCELYPPYRGWIDQTSSEAWADSDVSDRIKGMTVAGYHVLGWYDLFCESGLQMWRQLRENAGTEYARHSQRLIVGFWPHGLFASQTPNMDFGPGSDIVSGAHGEMVSWLRDAVEDKAVETGIRIFVMGSNEWRDLADWPPPVTEVELFLESGVKGAQSRHGDGSLTSTTSPGGDDQYRHDPSNPVPSVGGRLLGLWLPLPGPADQREVEDRVDVLVFQTPPLTSDVTVIGEVRVSVNFASEVGTTDLTAKLVDVYPDGRAMNIVDSIIRSQRVPDRAESITVTLGSTAQTFRSGHRICLEIASSSSPQYEVNSAASTQRLYYGGEAASRLTLPVAEGASALREKAP